MELKRNTIIDFNDRKLIVIEKVKYTPKNDKNDIIKDFMEKHNLVMYLCIDIRGGKPEIVNLSKEYEEKLMKEELISETRAKNNDTR